MDESENSNGLFFTETVIKNVTSEHHDLVVENGYNEDHVKTEVSKLNGNHSDETNSEINRKTPENNQENSNDLKDCKDEVRVEEDMDNSAATSNVSDISAYEDSEKSMDISENRVDCDSLTDKSNERQRNCEFEIQDQRKDENFPLSKPEENVKIDNDEKSLKNETLLREMIDYDDKSVAENSQRCEENKQMETIETEESRKVLNEMADVSNKKNSIKIVQSNNGVDIILDNDSNILQNETSVRKKIDCNAKSVAENSSALEENKEKETVEIEKENRIVSNKADVSSEKDSTEIQQPEENVKIDNDSNILKNETSVSEKIDCYAKSVTENSLALKENKEKETVEIEEESRIVSNKADVSSEKDSTEIQQPKNGADMTLETKLKNKLIEKTDALIAVEEDKNRIKPNLKSVDKVTDVDGSEILITINEEIEESDNEENEIKEKKDTNLVEVQEPKKIEKLVTQQSNEVVIINKSINYKSEIAATVPVLSQPLTTVVNFRPGTVAPNSMAATTVRFPLMPGPVLQYTVPPSSRANSQNKYINVGGQQILITVPVSSIGSVVNTVNSFPSVNVNMVAATFPPPNPNKSALDKTLDIDIPQSSWEQIELIKHEVLTRKPDNAFWGGLANVSKKAELSNVSKFLFDLGSDIVKECAYEQIVMVQKKKEDSDQLNDTEKESLQRMKKVVHELRDKLKYFHDLPKLKCSCGFTTDSYNVMCLHKEYPHTDVSVVKISKLSCAHCNEEFEGKLAADFFRSHLAKEHKGSGKFYNKPSHWQCNFCPFEGSNRNNLTKHQLKCLKNFKQHLNLAPHHVDINLSLKNIFYKFQVNNKKLQQTQVPSVDNHDTRSKLPIAQNKPIIQNNTLIQPKPVDRPVIVNPNRPIMPTQFQPSPITGVSPSNTWQNNYSRMMQAPMGFPVEGPRYAQVQKPPPLLKQGAASKPTVNQLLKTQQTNALTNRAGFEVCEICGGYVKDRMSLRIHFFYAHKIEMPAHVFSKPLAPLFCNVCNERFWTSQGFAKHKTSLKHLENTKKLESVSNQCWICHQKPGNLYHHLHKFHRLTTSECMILKRCMFCGILSDSRKDLELHMAATHGVLIKSDETAGISNAPVAQPKPVVAPNVSTKNLSTVVTGGSSGMVRNNYCVFCSTQFPDNTKLTLHCLSVHATCKKCGMVVNKAADLAKHVCKISSKTCSVCGMKNLKPAGLIKHLETHTKPCKVALKRLSLSEIEHATKGKYKRDCRLRSRISDDDISSSGSKASNDGINSLTVAMNFGKEKSKKKVRSVITLDDKTKTEEVIIESDNDSDIIMQEEKRTEIVLDSDSEDVTDEQKMEKREKKDKEFKTKTQEDTYESEKKTNKCELEHGHDIKANETEKNAKDKQTKQDKSSSDDSNDFSDKESSHNAKISAANSRNSRKRSFSDLQDSIMVKKSKHDDETET